MVKKFVMVDLELLADTSWRQSMVEQADWDTYYAALIDDEPTPLAQVVRDMHDANILTCAYSTRPEKWRQLTTEWLLKHNLLLDDLLLRPDDNYMRQELLKPFLVREFMEGDLTGVMLVIDDLETSISAFKAAGLNVMRPA